MTISRRLDKSRGAQYTSPQFARQSGRLAAFVIMRYDIRDRLGQADAEITCRVSAPAPPGTGGEFQGDIIGQVALRNTGRTILARGVLRAVVIAECSRCLKPHLCPIEFDFCEDCALSQIDDPVAYSAEFRDDEPVPIPILDHQMVDLSELIRQLLVLHLPSHPICSPDCRGLCPECGADLNVSACSCRTPEPDPRLAPLRDLLR